MWLLKVVPLHKASYVFLKVCACARVSVCVRAETRGVSDPRIDEVTGGCELPYVGAKNQTLVLRKNSM